MSGYIHTSQIGKGFDWEALAAKFLLKSADLKQIVVQFRAPRLRQTSFATSAVSLNLVALLTEYDAVCREAGSGLDSDAVFSDSFVRVILWKVYGPYAVFAFDSNLKVLDFARSAVLLQNTLSGKSDLPVVPDIVYVALGKIPDFYWIAK